LVKFNAFEFYSDEFHCITMDQRNAIGGESSGPVAVDDPWEPSPTISWIDGASRLQAVFLHGLLYRRLFAFKLMERAPERILAAYAASRSGTGRTIRTSCTIPARISGLRN